MPDQTPEQTTPVSSGPQSEIQEPPSNFGGIIRQLGPGLIIAASIVGSGELIATTKTGAQAGISLLWLIVVGCVIKVFVQIELGRLAIGQGETTLTSLNKVPGPRLVVNWIIWYWLIMMLVGFGQLGGIIGGVGQSLALARPLTGDYIEAVRLPSETELKRFIAWTDDDTNNDGAELKKLSDDQQTRVTRGQGVIAGRLSELEKFEKGKGQEILGLVRTLIEKERAADAAQSGNEEFDKGAFVKQEQNAVDAELDPWTWDDKYWSVVVAILTICLLVRGKYGLIQNVSTVLVVAFTFVTLGNVIALQFEPAYGLSMAEIFSGLIPSLPPEGIVPPGLPYWTVSRPVATALATFGIIGVGATELVAYPYWCIEKGYAKYTGPNTKDAAWYQRANGWIRVMKWDAFASMVIYTIATIAFFFMGVAVMYAQGLDPEGMRMVSTLLEQYVPIFGGHAKWLFLAGAIAVLYSTYLVANAAWTRVYTDAFKVFGLMSRDNQKAHDKSIFILAIVLPLISMGLWCSGINPVKLVLLSGLMQAVMLPMLGFAALYFRYTKTDKELQPGRAWDACLIISSIGLLIAGGWGVYSNL
ncbi:MAG: Nramp family divalent metal transporter [Planctomycetota bacterium]|nr:Nramp family divalent metal transporter [Planctomycetota bacterium]